MDDIQLNVANLIYVVHDEISLVDTNCILHSIAFVSIKMYAG